MSLIFFSRDRVNFQGEQPDITEKVWDYAGIGIQVLYGTTFNVSQIDGKKKFSEIKCFENTTAEMAIILLAIILFPVTMVLSITALACRYLSKSYQNISDDYVKEKKDNDYEKTLKSFGHDDSKKVDPKDRSDALKILNISEDQLTNLELKYNNLILFLEEKKSKLPPTFAYMIQKQIDDVKIAYKTLKK